MSSLKVINKDAHRISIKMDGVPLPYANALRRICLNGIPTFAIDTVDVIENTSVLPDEGLAHRLGLVPLGTDMSRFNEPSGCSCDGNGCVNCTVILVLDTGESAETRTIYSSDLSSEDTTVKPTSDKVPIVDLAPGQKVKVECYARLGRGTEHAKWNSANVSTLVDSSDGGRILTVESAGSLKPEQVVLSGIEEVGNKLAELNDALDHLEAR